MFKLICKTELRWLEKKVARSSSKPKARRLAICVMIGGVARLRLHELALVELIEAADCGQLSR